MARNYVSDLAGGTATATIQMQGRQTLKQAVFSMVTAAAGTVELSLAAASQIGTTQPTQDVLARLKIGATAGNIVAVVPLSLPVVAFQNVYVHQTGAGNLGSVTLA